jgi:hypothetical protein
MEQLESAVRHRRRVVLRRRGNEFVVIAAGLTQQDGRDALIGHIAMTGELLVFLLDDLDAFQVLET